MKNQKFEVGFLVNNEMFQTVVEAKNEAEAFCLARNKAEKWYFQNGVNCTSIESINNPQSYVKPCKEVTQAELLEMFAELETMGIN